MDQEIISKVAETVSANFILPIIKDLVLPKIQELIPSNQKKQVSITENIEAYLTRRYEKFAIIDTLVFPNKQTLFDLLYLPLTLNCQNSIINENILVDSYPKDLLPKYNRVLIEDTAGMGKSTVSKKLFRSCVETNNGIPVLIELRKINPQNSILEDIQKQLSPLSRTINLDEILKLIQKGSFVFFFDGLDEISKKDRGFVLQDLHSFIEKANNNYFLITSRPDNSLSSFGDFQKFEIKPLTISEAHLLIQKYDFYSFQKIAEPLINKLTTSESRDYSEFLTIPFLVSLLYKSFDFKKDIPHKKTQFYGQVYSALFEAHDLSKDGYLVRDKHSNLHHDDFERVLRYIGYYTSMENKVEYENDYILNVITIVSKKLPTLSFKASDLLKDLIESVPLFRKEGDYYKWAHKSLQDYFCAKFIYIDLNEKKEIVLKSIYNDNKLNSLSNILDLYYELDTNVFRQTILTWYLEDFENHFNILNNHLIGIPSEHIKNRASFTFGKRLCLIQSNLTIDKLFLNEELKKFVRSCDNGVMLNKPAKYIGNKFFLIHGNQSQISSLTMIVRKKESQIFVSSLSPKKFQDNKKIKNILSPNCLHFFDEKSSNILNQPDNFEIINNFLNLGIKNHLDYDKSMELLALLRKQKKDIDLNDFLNLP